MLTRYHASVATLLLGFSTASFAADLAVRLTDGAGKPLAEAVVFVPGAKAAARAPAPRRATIVQRNRVFDPFVTVVEKGASIDFPNEDTMLHHVYSFSPAKQFELKLYRGTPPAPVLFDTSGVIALGCNLHDWMLAYVLVVDTPHFAKSAADGVARVTGVPAGTYDLMGWYPGMREPVRLQQVTLAGSEQSIEHRMSVPIKTRPPAPARDPLRY